MNLKQTIKKLKDKKTKPITLSDLINNLNDLVGKSQVDKEDSYQVYALYYKNQLSSVFWISFLKVSDKIDKQSFDGCYSGFILNQDSERSKFEKELAIKLRSKNQFKIVKLDVNLSFLVATYIVNQLHQLHSKYGFFSLLSKSSKNVLDKKIRVPKEQKDQVALFCLSFFGRAILERSSYSTPIKTNILNDDVINFVKFKSTTPPKLPSDNNFIQIKPGHEFDVKRKQKDLDALLEHYSEFSKKYSKSLPLTCELPKENGEGLTFLMMDANYFKLQNPTIIDFIEHSGYVGFSETELPLNPIKDAKAKDFLMYLKSSNKRCEVLTFNCKGISVSCSKVARYLWTIFVLLDPTKLFDVYAPDSLDDRSKFTMNEKLCIGMNFLLEIYQLSLQKPTNKFTFRIDLDGYKNS